MVFFHSETQNIYLQIYILTGAHAEKKYYKGKQTFQIQHL